MADLLFLLQNDAPVKAAIRALAPSPGNPPANTVAPSISGTAQQGQTLTGSDGTWTGSPTFARQWLRGSTAISGATGSTYVLTSADVGFPVSFKVTGTNVGGSATATSAATVTVTAAPSLSLFKAAVAGVKAGTRRATVLVIGDSTSFGEHGGDAEGGNGYDSGVAANSWPYVMAAALNSAGVPSQANGFFGDGGVGNYNDFPYVTFNPQWSPQQNWYTLTRASYPGAQAPGGSIWITNTPSSYCVWNPPGAFTKVKLFAIVEPGAAGSVYTVQIDSNPITWTAPSVSTPTCFEINATCPRGTHTVYVNLASGNAALIAGGYVIDETVPAVDVLNAGNRGSAAGDWAANLNTAEGIDKYAPDLTIIMPPINDLTAGNSVSGFQASIDTLVAKAKLTGDVLLVNAAAIRIGGPNNRPSQATRDTYTAAMQAVATKYSLPPIIDLQTLGAWDASLYFDDLHPLKARYAAMGQMVAASIRNLIA